MKKRMLAMLLALVMLTSVVPFTAMAAECTHSKTSHDIHAATCVDGVDKLVCDDCGEVLSTTVLPAVEEHLFVPPINDGKCLKCNATKDADPCEHEKTHTEIIAPSCKAEGFESEVCDACGEVLSQTKLDKTDDHTFLPNHKGGEECLNCGAKLQDVCEHDYEITKEEPGNCVIPGYAWEKCKLCGKETNRETTVDANVHQGFVKGKCACGFECPHEKTITVRNEPSCAEEGSEKVICDLCGNVLSEEKLEKTDDHTFLPNHKEGKECLRCNAKLQDVCEHDYEVVNAEPGNCTLTGYAWEVCKLCGKEYNHETDTIPSAHNFVNGRCATCFKPCECDMEYVDFKAATCAEEGYSKVRCVKCDKVLFATAIMKTNVHVFKDDYENGKKCSLCDANLQDVCEHDYDTVREEPGTCKANGYIWEECKLCGKETNHETPVDPNGHVYKTLKWELPTCEAAGHIWQECTLCGHKDDREDGAAMGHKFENGKCFCGEPDPNCPHTSHVENMSLYRPATCTVDGVHVYDCPNCGTQQCESIPMLGHDKVEKKVAATCTTEGLRIVSCVRCKQLLEEETLAATGHSYVNDKCACGAVNPVTVCKHPQNLQATHTQAATCTEDGYTIVTCNGCDTILSRVVLEHKGHTGETTVHAPTCTVSGAKIEICTTCHAQLSYKTLPATGHNHVNGICSSCGAVDPNRYTNDYQDLFLVG